MPEPKRSLGRSWVSQVGEVLDGCTYSTMVKRGAITEPYWALFAPPVTLPLVDGETMGNTCVSALSSLDVCPVRYLLVRSHNPQ